MKAADAEGEDEDLLKMRFRRLPASEARSHAIDSLLHNRRASACVANFSMWPKMFGVAPSAGWRGTGGI
jgi:hypothetical protein